MLVFVIIMIIIITFRIWHSQAKCIVATAVCVSVSLSVCPSPHSHTTAWTDPDGEWYGVPSSCAAGHFGVSDGQSASLHGCTIGRICNQCKSFVAMAT